MESTKIKLEKLFSDYAKKELKYSNAVIWGQDGNQTNAMETRGLKQSSTKAHKKFTKEFKRVHGDDISHLLEWQNARS